MTLGQIAILLISLGLFGVTFWLGYREIQKWRDRSTIISMNQLIIRLINCVLLVWLVSWFTWGVLTLDPATIGNRQSLIFWNNCLMLGMIVMGIAVFDFTVIWVFRRRTGKALRQETHERHARMLAELEAERSRYEESHSS